MPATLDPVAPMPAEAAASSAAWSVQQLDLVDSTNRLAARLPAWTALVARDQTAGRGRYERRWTSGEGGLWLSAVLPAPGPAARWQLLPLAAGLALLDALAPLGLPDVHLRWPNDLLVGSRKLAGILVERHPPHTAVVGIGLNIHNQPASLDPSLAPVATRLAAWVSDPASLDPRALTARILAALRAHHADLLADEPHLVTQRLNARWSRPRAVRVTLDSSGELIDGDFLGVDPRGALLLRTLSGTRTLDPLQVRLLREV
jgi:BirA family biotin operon repressor/biotin-[acetyl-CoA-carboxylase] ligase